MTSLHTLAFEIGTEEIPAFDLHRATVQLESLVPAALDALRIPHADVTIYTTPRRLIAVVSDVAETTEALQEVFRGPSAKIAFDDEGNPTKAAIGFARGKGLGTDALERREENGTDYVFVTREVPASSVAELLPAVLRSIIDDISWPKSCHWGSTSETFSRPVRWLVALLDDQVIPVEFAGLCAGALTYGHRFLAPGSHKVDTAANLVSIVEGASVVTSEAAREAVIREGVKRIERETGLRAELPEKTLLEVVNLAEYPSVLLGTFEESFLQVPEEIIVDAMLMHQRYFPLYDHDNKLTNKFIVVSNGNPAHADIIISGNERVVRPRLSDAKFFYEEDLKQPLEAYVPRLDEVVFQVELGTMKAKTDRMVALAQHVVSNANLGETETSDALRAAYLAKADLVTNAVVEFTSVQGVMGSYYAAASGENERVAQAIADHYRPRFSGDDVPASVVGRVVAFSDKLDTICGLFAVGQAPTGSSDPFALRRSAIGMVAMLEGGLPVLLSKAIEASLAIYEKAGVAFDRASVRTQIAEFFVTRTKVMLRERGMSADAVDAVLAVGVEEPAEIIARTQALESARTHEPETFDDLAIAYARANNLRDATLGDGVDEAKAGNEEKTLLAALRVVDQRVEDALAVDDYTSAFAALAQLRSPIDAFFTDVMVMDEDEGLRTNRLRLLNLFVGVFANVADFGKMAKGSK